MDNFEIIITVNGIDYSVFNGNDKTIARRLYNKFHNLGAEVICKWYSHNSGIVRIIKY